MEEGNIQEQLFSGLFVVEIRGYDGLGRDGSSLGCEHDHNFLDGG
jgi:hypothetical protein